MSLKYRFIYCAFFVLLFVIAFLIHKIFFVFFFLYLIWMIYKNEKIVLIMSCILIVMIVLNLIKTNELSTYIEGKVVKSSEYSCIVKTKQGKIKVIHNELFEYNDFVELSVEEVPFKESKNDHSFDEKKYLAREKVFLKAKVIKTHSVEKKKTLYSYIEKRMSEDEKIKSFQQLFLFGEKSNEIKDDYTLFKELSLVHLFALSGMHINVLFLLLSSIFGLILTRIPKKIVIYSLLFIYIISIPTQVSFIRAFFMLLCKDVSKQRYNDLDIWSVLFCVSIVYNPYVIYNVSFVFSYFMSFMIIILKHVKYKEILLSLSSFPILLYLNYQLPLISLLCAVFFPLFIQSFYICICLSVFFPIVNIFLYYHIELLQKVTSLLYDIEFFLHFSKPNFLFIVTYYTLYFYMIYRLSFRKKVKKLVLMLLSLMIAFYSYSHYKVYAIVTMIDVGQGDCVLIRLPYDKGNILIDTGGHKDYDIATSTLIPYFKSIGINRLDFVYISHDDLDHSGALKSLQENFDIREVIDYYEAKRTIGPLEVEMLTTKKVYFNDNDNSLILKITLFETTFLFMGDASIEVEKDLMEEYPYLKADVLKVGHHGSKTSTSAAFLDHLDAQIAMIGVKEKNIYKHPSMEVIERLERKKYTILRTDQDGMFHIVLIHNSRYIYR